MAGAITEGHARALGGLPTETQAHVVAAVVEDDLSVRQTEELVRRLREPRPIAREAAAKPAADPDVERVEEDLRRSLGTKVRLDPDAARRPDHDRVLRRRGARAALPAARRGAA